MTKLGIKTTPGATYALCRTMAPGTARKPAAPNWFSPQPSVFSRTLSKPGAPVLGIGTESFSRNDSSTAFFSHSCTTQPPAPGSATRNAPVSSAASASSTARRAGPAVPGDRVSRCSQSCSISGRRLVRDMRYGSRLARADHAQAARRCQFMTPFARTREV